jgi:UDP-N-acetylmuramoyl-tripeptide--D-alanyl-D-alanine ligase
VKEMLAAILSQGGPILATEGNLNNDIGVPLNLFRLSPEHRYAVIEMGCNRRGDIATLTAIAPPAVSAITLCAPAHLEGLGSIEGVAQTKGEIIQGLIESGVAAINADDAYAEFWRGLAGKRRVIDFGFTPGAAVTVAADSLVLEAGGSRFRLECPAGSAAIELRLAGRHNVMNALAAAACACALDIPIAVIQAGLQAASPVKGRLQPHTGHKGCRVIDDSYNANPSSLRAGIEVLKQYPGRRWLVFGDMGELGPGAPVFHREVGEYAREAGIDALFATGKLAREAADGFGTGAAYFDDTENLGGALREMVADDVTLLVKGSRSMRMERVVQALLGKE